MGANLHAGQFFGQVRKPLNTGGVLLSEVVHNSRRSVPKHAHEPVYLSMLLSGQNMETIGSREFDSPVLDTVFHPENFEHRNEIGPAGARFFCIEIRSNWFDSLDTARAKNLPSSVLEGDSVFLMRKLLSVYLRDGDQTAHLEAESLTAELIGSMCEGLRVKETSRPPWLARVEEYLRVNFFQQLTLEDAALQVGVHPVHLSRVFRRVHRQTMGDYLNKLRAEFISRKLADPSVSLAAAALDAGFADQAHLTRVFKQLNGITPGALRKTLLV